MIAFFFLLSEPLSPAETSTGLNPLAKFFHGGFERASQLITIAAHAITFQERDRRTLKFKLSK